jgi:thiol-disulfide isomerase/thioredoxin
VAEPIETGRCTRRLLLSAACLAVAAALSGCGLGADGPVPQPPPGKVEVVVFTAKWCSVCGRVPPLIEGLKAEFPTIAFRLLDVDDEANGKLAAEYKAESVPYFVVVIDGRVEGTVRGLASQADTAKLIRRAIRRAAARAG